MKIQASSSIFLLRGHWQLITIDRSLHGQWQEIKRYDNDDFTWRFHADGIVTTESHESYHVKAFYNLNPDSSFLKIDGYSITPQGEKHARVLEHYRVEVLSADEIYLYDLEGIENESFAYRLSIRFHLKRIGDI